MELRQILNRAESTIITAKSFNANNNMAGVQSKLLDLKEFLNRELVNHSAEQPAAEQPDEDELNKVAGEQDAAGPEAVQAESPNEPKDGAIKSFKLPESKDGAGIVSEPAEQESKPGSGVVSKPEKSQNKAGSGVV